MLLGEEVSDLSGKVGYIFFFCVLLHLFCEYSFYLHQMYRTS